MRDLHGVFLANLDKATLTECAKIIKLSQQLGQLNLNFVSNVFARVQTQNEKVRGPDGAHVLAALADVLQP